MISLWQGVSYFKKASHKIELDEIMTYIGRNYAALNCIL